MDFKFVSLSTGPMANRELGLVFQSPPGVGWNCERLSDPQASIYSQPTALFVWIDGSRRRV
jgi:hypothetical protein